MSVSAPEHTLLRSAKNRFPNLVVVTGSQREFFEKKGADVLLASAEGVLPGPLLYPAYCVVVPTPSKVFQSLSYAVETTANWESSSTTGFGSRRLTGLSIGSAITGSSEGMRLPTDLVGLFCEMCCDGSLRRAGLGGFASESKSGELRQTTGFIT